MAKLKQIEDFFFRGITSGKEASDNPQALDELVSRILFNVITLFGGIFLFPMGVYRIYQGRFFLGTIELAIVAFFILAYILSLLKISFFILSFTVIVILMVLCGISLNTEFYMVGMMMSILFPMVLIYELGLKVGTILSFLMGTYIAYARWAHFFVAETQDFQIAGTALYAITFVFSIAQNVTKNYKDTVISRINSKLESAHGQVTAMKDNLKTGIFLMDTDCIIQPQYSKALENILGLADLEGRDFIVLLSLSLSPKESATIRSFFGMLTDHAHDVSLLEEANPLDQFQYVHNTSLETKILRSSFSPITDEDEQTFIFGTLEDISQETELKKQLSEEEDKRKTEMNNLFELLHVEPEVLLDFIEDSDFEFLHINNTLRSDDEASSDQILKEIYRSIHAIKANALVLGLSNYSDQLHICEDEIKKIRDSESESKLDDLLRITFYLENLMKINDNIKSTIDRMSAFSKDTPRKEETKVFLELLERTVSRTAEAKNKLVRFTVNRIDERAIASNARRMIKEILIQLIRNAVTHGIEPPERRLALGKNETGRIDLSIIMSDNIIKIILEEDGMGIDYPAVAKHAEKLNLITAVDRTDKLKLLNLLFSDDFSTAKIVDLYAGRGAGLSLVKRIVHELNGTLKIKSKDGIGVIWNVAIPIE